jgi:hypothetical protein
MMALGSLCLEDWVFLSERKREWKLRKSQKKEKDKRIAR